MTVADDRYPELHRIIERLEPEQAAIVHEQILRFITPPRGLSVLGVFDGPEGNLDKGSEEIISIDAAQARTLQIVRISAVHACAEGPGRSRGRWQLEPERAAGRRPLNDPTRTV